MEHVGRAAAMLGDDEQLHIGPKGSDEEAEENS
jgi:hypothetical protein